MHRFWAWNSYVPFSCAFFLVFFGHWNGETVLLLMLLGAVPFQLLLNRLEDGGRGETPDDQWGLPKTPFLKLSISACFGGVFYSILSAARSSATLEQKVGNFFVDIAAPWAFGSFASQIPEVAFASFVAATAWVLCITPPRPGAALVAKLALGLLLCLSLFTLWVTSSNVDTVESAAGLFLETLVKGLIKIPIDLCVTVAWFVALAWALAEVGRESAKFKAGTAPAEFVPPHMKVVLPLAGWASLVGAILLSAVRA